MIHKNNNIIMENKLNKGTEEDIMLKFLSDKIQGTEWENKVFLAGGAVRDEIMGLKPKDLDFTVLGDLNSGINFSVWLGRIMGNFRKGSNPVIYERFGTSKLATNKNKLGLPEMELEFVAPRKETYEPGSRKPIVTAGSIEDDARRRDLTINSLLKNISTGKVFDVTGRGVSDIKAGIVKTTSEPDVIFREDPLRMLRAIRFTVKYGFNMEADVFNGIKKHASLIDSISKERIADEFSKILVSPEPVKGMNLLRDMGLLKYIIPELTQAVGMTQNHHHHEDVYDHIMTVVSKTPANLETRLMALLHDIGKVKTRTEENGDVHFYDHENVGAHMAKDILSRMKFSNAGVNIDNIVSGIANHMRLKQAGDEGTNVKDKTLRRFANSVGPSIGNILDLIDADNKSHANASNMPNQIANIRVRINSLEDKVDSKQLNLPITGHDLIGLGLKPGPMFKEIMSIIEDAWYENTDLTKEEAMKLVDGYLLSQDINEIKTLMKLKH